MPQKDDLSPEKIDYGDHVLRFAARNQKNAENRSEYMGMSWKTTKIQGILLSIMRLDDDRKKHYNMIEKIVKYGVSILHHI